MLKDVCSPCATNVPVSWCSSEGRTATDPRGLQIMGCQTIQRSGEVSTEHWMCVACLVFFNEYRKYVTHMREVILDEM